MNLFTVGLALFSAAPTMGVPSDGGPTAPPGEGHKGMHGGKHTAAEKMAKFFCASGKATAEAQRDVCDRDDDRHEPARLHEGEDDPEHAQMLDELKEHDRMHPSWMHHPEVAAEVHAVYCAPGAPGAIPDSDGADACKHEHKVLHGEEWAKMEDSYCSNEANAEASNCFKRSLAKFSKAMRKAGKEDLKARRDAWKAASDPKARMAYWEDAMREDWCKDGSRASGRVCTSFREGKSKSEL